MGVEPLRVISSSATLSCGQAAGVKDEAHNSDGSRSSEYSSSELMGLTGVMFVQCCAP